MANTRAELLDEVVAKITSGNRSTTAANLREVLNDFIDSAFIPVTDGPPSGKYKGEWVSGPYKDGDSVLHSSLLWQANADNTNEEPGTGPSWDLQITNNDTYGFGYLGSSLGVTQNIYYQENEKKEDKLISISAKTSDYTLVLSDKSSQLDFDKSSGINCTIPTNASVAFEVGTVIILCQKNTGQLTIVASGGVTLLSADSLVKTRTQYSYAFLEKVSTDTWRLVGDLA